MSDQGNASGTQEVGGGDVPTKSTTFGSPDVPRERPILFSAPMVRALLAGTKTQTRRIVKPLAPPTADGAGVISSPDPKSDGLWFWLESPEFEGGVPVGDEFRCPYGVPGDVLWVREAHALHERFSDVVRVVYSASLPGAWSEAHQDFPAHRADGLKIKPFQQGFRPSIHMPRWASRISLRVTDVRVERLQEISEADALAEGIFRWPLGYGVHEGDPAEHRTRSFDTPQAAYRCLWEQINGPGSWDANPWVWAVNFERTS